MAVGDCGPGVRLRGGRCGEGGVEPFAGDRAEPAQGIGRLSGSNAHPAMVPTAYDNWLLRLATAARYGMSPWRGPVRAESAAPARWRRAACARTRRRAGWRRSRGP